MLNVRPRRRTGRILADHEGGGTVRIDVIGAILCVIFQDENRSVLPERAVRDGIDHTAQSEIVVRDIRGWPRFVRARAACVVVRQVQQDERWQLKFRPLVSFVGANVGAKLIQEFIRSHLVGVIGIKVRIQRIEMIAQHRLGCLDAAEQRNCPRPGAASSMRIADVWRQRVALMQLCPRTFTLLSRGSSFLGLRRLPASVAPLGIHELSINAKAHVIAI